MLKVLSPDQFKQQRREPLLDYKLYLAEAQDLALRIPRVAKNMASAEWMADKNAASVMPMTNSRAINALNFLTLSYSAGMSIADLRGFYPLVLESWEGYAKAARAFDDGPEYAGSLVAHFALQGDEFDAVNRMVCLGILLGWGDLLPRLVPIIDYRNPVMDGLLDRLLCTYVPGRPQAANECTRHSPYSNTLKIFAADRPEQAALVAAYLDDWYAASKREPYYNSLKKGSGFRGYWSWEAAAITFLLEIDDFTYANARFYPTDLAQFARAMDLKIPRESQ